MKVVWVVGRPRVSTDSIALLAFWRMHINAWLNSDLSIREYCTVYDLDRKHFLRWRQAVKDDDRIREFRALRRGRGGRKAKIKTELESAKGHRPSSIAQPEKGRRRHFAAEIKRQIVEETCQPGMTVSEVARRYNLNPGLIFNWRRECGLSTSQQNKFVPVRVIENGAEPEAIRFETPDTLAQSPDTALQPGLELQLLSGRRVRFDGKMNPSTMRLLIAALEENPAP